MTYRSWTATRDWQVDPLGLVHKGGGWQELALPIESIAQGAPTLLGIGSEYEIIAPAALRAAIHMLAEQVVTRTAKTGMGVE